MKMKNRATGKRVLQQKSAPKMFAVGLQLTRVAEGSKVLTEPPRMEFCGAAGDVVNLKTRRSQMLKISAD